MSPGGDGRRPPDPKKGAPSLMRILCMLPAARGVYPPEAAERRLNLMRSYTTPATQVDVDDMPAASGFSPWGSRAGAEPPPDAAARAAHLIAQQAVQAEQEGYDAFCPFGTLDIGVREARTCRSPVAPLCPAVKTASAPGRATRALRPCWWPLRPSASRIPSTPSAARSSWTVSWPVCRRPGSRVRH